MGEYKVTSHSFYIMSKIILGLAVLSALAIEAKGNYGPAYGHASSSYGYAPVERYSYNGYAPPSYGYAPRERYGYNGYAPPSYGYTPRERYGYNGYAPPSYNYAPRVGYGLVW